MQTYEWHIAVIMRVPSTGVGKRRLVEALGEAATVELQRSMAEEVVRQALAAAAAGGGHVAAHVTGGPPDEVERWLGIEACDQGGGDLGERIERALEAGLARAPVSAVIGADCPSVTATDILEAVAAAARSGAAFAPATDGGYCLLAVDGRLRGRLQGLFAGCEWGTCDVLRQSVERLQAAGIEPALLEARQDIDTPADLASWHALVAQRSRD